MEESYFEKRVNHKIMFPQNFWLHTMFCSTSRIYRNFFQKNIFSGVIAKYVQRILNIYRQQDSLTPIVLGRITDLTTAHSLRVGIETEQQNSTDSHQKT